MYYLEAGYGKHNRLRNAMILALAVHLILLAGVSFDAMDGSDYTPQIEVTLATRPSTAAPDKARHVAQANQAGDAEPADNIQSSSPDPALSNQAPAPQEAMIRPEDTRDDPRRDAITTAAAAQRAITAAQPDDGREPDPLMGINPEVDRLARELAGLEAELNEQSRSYADMPRVRRLTSVSARQAVDAAYLLDWRRRVEAVGNKYYPEASVRYGIYGNLRLLVVIRQDGSLEDIRVLSSSGYAVLDEAAIKIVRMAAPYAPFPAELKATTDRLEIIRTWQFQENQLSSK
jgi:periplasmic protein TonB